MRLEGGGPSTGAERVPRLAPGCDPARLSLTPAEGYLLSRIDGATPLSLLRQIAALPPARRRPLPRALGEGGRGRVGAAPARRAGAAAPAAAHGRAAATAPRAAAPAPGIDPSLDLPVEMQERVIEFEARLDRPYHEILGVAPDADSKTIKQAYFGLSKQFHPDRYFRRNLGPYARARRAHLQEGPRGLRAALGPGHARRGAARSCRGRRAPSRQPSARRVGAAGSPPTRAGLRAAAERPRASIAARFEDRKRKAKSFFESGMAALQEGALARGRRQRAPRDRLRSRTTTPTRAPSPTCSARPTRSARGQLLKEADGALPARATTGTRFRLYEEALHYRPFDAELSHKTGRLAWKLGGDLRKAKEYAMAACELAPDNAAYRRTLGQIYKAAGLDREREARAPERARAWIRRTRSRRQELKTLVRAAGGGRQ